MGLISTIFGSINSGIQSGSNNSQQLANQQAGLAANGNYITYTGTSPYYIGTGGGGGGSGQILVSNGGTTLTWNGYHPDFDLQAVAYAAMQDLYSEYLTVATEMHKQSGKVPTKEEVITRYKSLKSKLGRKLYK